MKDATKARKPVFRTESPFAHPKASQQQQPQHDALVHLLINTLSPIGAHSIALPKPPQKGNKKRKRRASSAGDAEREDAVPGEAAPRPQPPRIQEDVLVGFNAVTRHLETLSQFSNVFSEAAKEGERPRHVAAVFLLRPLDNLVYSHLPTMCHTASLASSDLPATRLVLLSPSMEKQVAAALAQSPSVSILAVLEGESEECGSRGLIDYVRKEVEAVEVPWLKQAIEGQWLGTKVDIQ